MMATSRMSGTSSMVVGPGARSEAAMSFRALFLAPVTRTRPVRAVPPVTSKHSTGPPYGGRSGDSDRERGRRPSRALRGIRRTGLSWEQRGSLFYARGHDGPAHPHLHQD